MEREDELDFAVIGSYRTAGLAHEAGLAVLASGHPYWVKPVEEHYLLMVMGEHAVSLKREIDHTTALNRFWPPSRLDLSAPSLSKVPTVGAVLLLCFAFWAQNRFPGVVELGANRGSVFDAGEWWRVLTAVTLHADVGHLAGNLLGLSIFAYLSCRYLGNGLAWLLIVVAAALANLSNAGLHVGENYSSLGASTAVFAALGLLAGYPVGAHLRVKLDIQTRDWLVPFFGGCIAFAWMGGGEYPTDVAGHFWAFGYGALLALGVAWTGLADRVNRRMQWALLSSTLALVGFSWAAALGLLF